MADVINHAKSVIAFYQDGSRGIPDPAFVLQLSDEVYSGSNLFAVQKLFDGNFQFDIFFESDRAGHKLTGKSTIYPSFIGSHLCTAEDIDLRVSELSAYVQHRFTQIFPPTDNDFDSPAVMEFSKAITANLMGGVGYFFGTSIVDKGFAYEWDQEDDGSADSDDDDSSGAASQRQEAGAKLTEPRALLTATPSRSFFPRGFYWYGPLGRHPFG
jgi:mannosyl-oligosaccharide glucosidase